MRHKDKVSAPWTEKFHPLFHLSELSCGEAGEAGRAENLRTVWGSWLKIRLSDEPFERQGSRAGCTQLFGNHSSWRGVCIPGQESQVLPMCLGMVGGEPRLPARKRWQSSVLRAPYGITYLSFTGSVESCFVFICFGLFWSVVQTGKNIS